jgi:hypothetical protein
MLCLAIVNTVAWIGVNAFVGVLGSTIHVHYQKFQSFVAVPSITPLQTQQQENVHVLYDGI